MEANDHIRIKGENGNSYRLSEACRDMTAHEKLTDSVYLCRHFYGTKLQSINSIISKLDMYTELYFVNNPLLIQVFEKISESDCENAKVILRRIQKREFYKSIAEIHPEKGKMGLLQIPPHGILFKLKTRFCFNINSYFGVLGSYLFTMDAQNIEKEVRAYIPQCEGVKITNGSTDSHHNVSSKTVSNNKLEVEQQQLTKDEVVVVVNNSGQSPNPIEKVKIKLLEKHM